MTDKKQTTDPQDKKQDIIYKNYPESAPETRGDSTLTMLFLVIWYIILGVAGIALLGFVALFVACMV